MTPADRPADESPGAGTAASRPRPAGMTRMIAMNGPELSTGSGYRARVGTADETKGVTTASDPGTRLAGTAAPAQQRRGGWLLAAGAVAFGAALATYLVYVKTHPQIDWMDAVDLRVYRDGGLIVRHIRPWYNPHRLSPLYGWPGYQHLQFTYPPFAAMAFTVLTQTSFWTLWKISAGVNIAALLATVWMTLGGLGYRRGPARLGATLLLAAPLFWTEPVQRTLYLGQIEIVLMTLIIWDQCQPDRRWWKGAGVGLAAGIKLVPLIFIPYLLLTRRFRQAAVASGTFAATILLGFAVLPRDSTEWWLDGLFIKGGRDGFIGWEGNQSLRAIITRLTGSVVGAEPTWLVVAALTAVAGLVCAAVLDRAGHRMVALLTCALTGLLISPVSWDHHWVWIVPGTVAAAGYAVRVRRRAARWAAAGLAVGIAGIFGAWPGSLWGEPDDLGGFSKGLIWAPPNTNPETYLRLGDRPWYVEYHWHGLQLLSGNLYLLTGIALFALLVMLAVNAVRAAGPELMRATRAPSRSVP
jgi:alpha-1,2-mannosyltransferase